MEKESALELLGSKQFLKLKSELQDMNPADIAILLEEMYGSDEFDEKNLIMLYRILPKELAAETFTYMDSEKQMVLINAFSDKELRDARKCGFPYPEKHRSRHKKTDKRTPQLPKRQCRFCHDNGVCLPAAGYHR